MSRSVLDTGGDREALRPWADNLAEACTQRRWVTYMECTLVMLEDSGTGRTVTVGSPSRRGFPSMLSTLSVSVVLRSRCCIDVCMGAACPELRPEVVVHVYSPASAAAYYFVLGLYSFKAVYGTLMRLVCRPGRLFRLFLPPRASSPSPTPLTQRWLYWDILDLDSLELLENHDIVPGGLPANPGRSVDT